MSKNREYPERPFVGVGVVILRNDEVLLIQRAKEPNKGQWSLPGGKQQLGETVIQTAHREIMEETGVEIEQLMLVDVVDVIVPDEAGKIRYHYTLVDFRARWHCGECCPGDDAQAVRWFHFNELDSLELWEKTSQIIRKAHRESSLT